MADFYWVGGTDSLASKYQNWSASSGGSALASWPGGSPGASDNFFFDSASAVHCTWESSVVSMANIQSIQQSLTAPYTGILNMTITTTMQGLILNAELQGSGVITLTGANLTALDDSASRKRYVLNGQKAKIDSYTGQYKISPAQAATYLDNGPYPAMTLDTQPITLAYNVPTSTVHDHADDATIHIKGAFVATSASGFLRTGAPNMSEDTKVKIKFDNPSITYASANLDFNMATAFFRGTEVPVTGSQTYGTVAAGLTVRHYGVVVFAGTPGEVCTIRNQTTLECYSLEVSAGAVFRAQGQGTNKPAKVNVQTQPIIKGVWAFHASNGNSFLSPKMSFVADVASGGTGLSKVSPNSLLMGNAAGAMQELLEISPGTNGYVLTMVGGTPAWAASGGGGGGSIGGSIANDQIAVGASTANDIEGSSKLTFTTPGSLTISTGTTDPPTINLAQNAAALSLKVLEPNDLFLSDGSDNGTGPGSRLTFVGRTFGTSSTSAGQLKLFAEHSGSNSDILTIRTNSGYLRLGPQNGSFCHFYTDRSYFYFNKPIQMDGGGAFYSYNDDLMLKTDDSGSGQPTRIHIEGGIDATRIGIGMGTPQTELDVAGTIRASTLVDLPILGGDANGDLHASGLTVRDEGSPLGIANSVTQFDFVGAGVVASRSSPTDPVVTVTVAGGGGGGTTALITSTNVATCPGPGGTITTTGDSRQIAYINGDPSVPITVTNPTADGIRLSIHSLTGFTTGAVSALAFLSPVLSTVNGLANSGELSAFSNAELIWKTGSIIDPTGNPGETPVSGWHLVSSQNFRLWNQEGLVI